MTKLRILRGPLNLRNDHNTASSNIRSFGVGEIVTIDPAKTFTAPEALYMGKTVYQQVGDKWAYVIADSAGNPVSGWCAINHMGITYSEIIPDDNPNPPNGNITIVKATVHYKRGSGDDVYTQDLFPQ